MGTSFLRAYVYMACARLFSEALFVREILSRTYIPGGIFSRPKFRRHNFPGAHFPGGGIFASRLNLEHGGVRMISKNKLSKKARRELDKQKRVTWDFSPVSRIKESKKVYNRKRLRNPRQG
jgi:hypothetical protein